MELALTHQTGYTSYREETGNAENFYRFSLGGRAIVDYKMYSTD
jgi:hypothetical protein